MGAPVAIATASPTTPAGRGWFEFERITDA
jgi:hypothetical protein